MSRSAIAAPATTCGPSDRDSLSEVKRRRVIAAARVAAAASGGHLATIAALFGPWLGGYQTDGAMEPDGGWSWVTGEPFVFSKWKSDQPSNGTSNERLLHFWAGAAKGSTWNDIGDAYPLAGYVIEIE